MLISPTAVSASCGPVSLAPIACNRCRRFPTTQRDKMLHPIGLASCTLTSARDVLAHTFLPLGLSFKPTSRAPYSGDRYAFYARSLDRSTRSSRFPSPCPCDLQWSHSAPHAHDRRATVAASEADSPRTAHTPAHADAQGSGGGLVRRVDSIPGSTGANHAACLIDALFKMCAADPGVLWGGWGDAMRP